MRRLAIPWLLALSACGGAAFGPGQEQQKGDAGADDAADEPSPAPDSGGRDVAPPPTEAGAETGPDAGPDAPHCTCKGDLSGVGLGDFAIAFTVQTTMHPVVPGYGAILDQRLSCDSMHPGWVAWLAGGSDDGRLTLQVYDGSSIFDNATSTAVVNDGQKHRVVWTRTAGATKLTVLVDGQAQGFAGQPAEALSGTLGMLQTGSDPLCSSNAAQPSEPFVGVIEDVCIAVGRVP